ncbi:MAG: NBR1-Ig-like domain-containing protein [Chloroflexota bacterium]
MKRKLSSLAPLIVLSLVLSACGSGNAGESAVATSVALTVAAQNTQAAAPTSTPEATEAVSASPQAPTAAPSPTSKPAANTGPNAGCLSANLVGETIPDGTILQPEETFTKTWTIKNSGTCTWDATYKFIFWSGDLMGGAYYYNLPQTVAPDQTISIPILLVAPTEPGSYRGYWRIQSPNGVDFGVGQYDESVWVDVVVSDSENPDYGVTSVTYDVVRDPAVGCPTNVTYTVSAVLTVNGPIEVKYRWDQSDGNESGVKTVEFEEAGSQTFIRTWTIHLGSATNPRWIAFVIVEPAGLDFGRATFLYDCQ